MPVTARAGISNSNLPEPFKQRQTRSLEDPEEAAEVFAALGDTSGDLAGFCDKITHTIADLAASSPQRQVPAPLDAQWAGGSNSWAKLRRQLEVFLVGDGPVEITDIDAWITHREDPETRYPGEHKDRLPVVLGGEKTKLDFNFRFFAEDIPKDLRQQGTPANLITIWAVLHYRDREGNTGELAVEPLVT